ncbi:ankyrin [Mollisia scopiformis]|uniref:Ankyrin n=1 Tax=Mollisia scopiformis TaxID=149040 RepID=A0A194XFE0_MOLSC|nr:ankyrin [Mollisia scopiformis]KUJ18861.1 ankyrin [Mollisia scopiformis]
MASPRQERPPAGFSRMASISTTSSGQRGQSSLARSTTMSTVSSLYAAETPRSEFQDQLSEMAVGAGVPLTLPRSLLSLPNQRAAPSNPSDKSGAEEFLMSLRPKRAFIGKSSKGFAKEEVLLALDKAIVGKKSVLLIEGLIQLAETAGANAGNSSSPFTTDKKGHAIPTLDYLFTQAEHSHSIDVWRLFLNRVSQRFLDASLAGMLKDRPDDIERIKSLLEFGANPELCQDRILDLTGSGSEELVEIVLLSPLLKNSEFLNQGLVKAAANGSLRNTSMLLLRGANGNYGQSSALKNSVSMQRYDLTLAIVTMTKKPISSSNLDDATGMISSWSREAQKPFLKVLLYAGASGSRTSKTLVPFIAAHDQDITSILTECLAFRHSTFPAPKLFQYAVETGKFPLALDVLRSSHNRSFSDYASTGVHLQLVRGYSEDPEETHKVLSELLTLGISGDYTSQMLVRCCAPEQIEDSHIVTLIDLLITTAGAKVNYSDGAALMLAIEAASPAIVGTLAGTKPAKKILNLAVVHTSSSLGDDNPAKLEIWSTLLDAGASGPSVDQELFSAIDRTPQSLKKVKVLLKGASLDHSEGKALVKAVQLERLDLLEAMLAQKTPQFLTFASVWKQTRKLFALAESGDGPLPYSLPYMQNIYEVFHAAAKGATPVDDLLVDATKCSSNEIALSLTRLFLRWGGSPNVALGAPLQACIKRSDTQTLAALLEGETSKTSLKYGFVEALALRHDERHAMLETIIGAGLERASLDAALPQVLREDPYDVPTVHLIVGAGAILHSSFGENLVPPSLNLDLPVVEMLLPSIGDKNSILLPLKAVLSSRKDWQSPDGESLPMVKMLVNHCGKGTWADGSFISGVKACNLHFASIFEKHLTSDSVFSDALQQLLVVDHPSFDRDRLSMTQYLLQNGARGNVIDKFFLHAARTLELEWITALYPYISDRSVALSAFGLVQNTKEAGNATSGNRLEIIQFLLKQGLDGPMVDSAFVHAASTADVKGMNEYMAFVTSTSPFSQALDILAQNGKLLVSREGMAAVDLLISKGASNVSVANAAKTAAKAHNLATSKLIIGMTQTHIVIHAAFQGLMEHPKPLNYAESRNILFYLLESGLGDEDTEVVARLAGSSFDLAVVKALSPLDNSEYLYDCALDAIPLADNTWLSTKGLEFVDYLLGKGVSPRVINKLIEAASEALSLAALHILLPACDDMGKAVELSFGSVVSDNARWTSTQGLHVVDFLLEYGAKGHAVEQAAAHAAETLKHDALDVLLKSPAAGIVIPAAFKALTRSKSGRLSSEQLTIASTLVKQGVSTENLEIAAIEFAKILDIEGLKVLSGSPRFRQVTDNVLRALLLDETLWRTLEGNRIIQFLIEKGASTKMIEASASKAAAALDIDALHNVLGTDHLFSVVEAAFTSMTELEKGWLCPEGLRIAEYLLQRDPSEGNINKAFVQASQYLYFDAVKLLEPYVSDTAVFNEALNRAVKTDSKWLSQLHLIELLLESGVEGDAVELALTKGAQALHLTSLELLAPKIDRSEIYTKAFAAAIENTQEWRRSLDVIHFLLQHGASGDPVHKAYLSACAALDLPAVTLLHPHISNSDVHSHAFRRAASNEAWSSPNYLEVLKFLYTEDIASDVIGVALVAAAEELNVAAVQLLSRNADQKVCTEAFATATGNGQQWTSEQGTEIVQILAEKGSRGDSVNEAFINSARLFRLDLINVLAHNVDRENVCVSLALGALLSTRESGDSWVSNTDALEILNILVSMGASGDSTDGALVLAAQAGNTSAVNILSEVVNDPQTFTAAFNAMTTSSTIWLDSSYFDLVGLLLSRGAADEGVHAALVSALFYVIDGLASQELLQLLLFHGADVDFDDGKSLQVAAQNARQDLFEMLLEKNPDSHSLYMALKAVLSNGLDEATVLALFKSVTDNKAVQARPNVNNNSELGLPLIFYCLNSYPTSARLVQEICDLGADLSATIVWDLYENEYDDPITDRLTPLLLSLDKKCSDEVIGVLLGCGAEINYISEESRATALMLAAGKGRMSVVSTLIDRGASVHQKDVRDRTPLCYASCNGDISVMKSILKKNPPRNDGSLHEAARELNADAVKLLIKAGHDIHFPSAKHGGRSPLCELCYACRGSKDSVALQRTLTELANANAQPLRKSRGRTAIFMAMENAHPGPVVTALIEGLLWKDLNDPQNIYEEGDHFYSATMYIKKGIIRQAESVANDLLERLVDFSAVDRYYAKERMRQPRDAVGMPQRIMDMDHKKWIRSSRLEEEQEDFERKLRRQDEEMANRQLLSQRQHLMVMEQRENLGQQQSAHVLDSHLLSMKLRDREHGMELRHQEENFDYRLGEMAAANQMKLHIEAGQFANKIGMQEQSRTAELKHYTQTQDTKLNYLGEEQTMRYNISEAQQQLRLGGIEKELGYKRELQSDEIEYREKLSNAERAELDRKLQFANQMNTGRVQLNRDLGDIDYASRQNKLQVENQNRQAQLQYQKETDRERVETMDTMNQQVFARNQNAINTQRAQGKIELDTQAGLSQIETETMQDKIQMTQQDRGHKIAAESRLGQVQNQNLYDRYQITQEDRNNLLETETRMGQIQSHNLQKKVITQLDFIQATNREKLGYQQATDQQRLGFQQNYDYQKLQTLNSEGRIQNSTLQDKNQLNLQFQYQSGNMRLGQQAQSRDIDLNYQQRSGNLEMRKQGFLHGAKMEEMRGQDYLNTRRVQGSMVTQQAQIDAARAKQRDTLQYRALGGSEDS